jgi:hypothetical protein
MWCLKLLLLVLHMQQWTEAQVFLQEVSAEYSDLIYHVQVHWLSWRTVLQRFMHTYSEVIHLLEGDKKHFLSYRKKLAIDLFYMTLPASSASSIRNFRVWIYPATNIQKVTSQIFPHAWSTPLLRPIYNWDIKLLHEEFKSRQSVSSDDKLLFKFTVDPFSSNSEEVLSDLKLETTDLQCSTSYKNIRNQIWWIFLEPLVCKNSQIYMI